MNALIARLNGAPVATIIQVIVTVIVALVGGLVTLTNPDALDFDQYVKYLGILSVGNGLLGVGRGINASAPKVIASELQTTELRSAPPLH